MNQQVPASPITDEQPRCWRCNKLLAMRVTRPWAIHCKRCRALNQSLPRGSDTRVG